MESLRRLLKRFFGHKNNQDNLQSASSNGSSSDVYLEKDRLKLLKAIDYEPQNLFNNVESSALGALKKIVFDLNNEAKFNKYSVYGQVSLGELFKVRKGQDTPKNDYYWAFAKRRIDFLIVEEEFESKYCRKYKSIVAVEVHGSGHYGKNKAMRMRQDEEKRLLLEKIGIPLLVINTEEEEKYDNADERSRAIYALTIGAVHAFLYKTGIIKIPF